MSGINDDEIDINNPDSNNNENQNNNEDNNENNNNDINNNSNENQQEETQNQENDNEQLDCECQYWKNHIEENSNEFNIFENWILKAMKLKVPEFISFIEDNENFDLIRLTIQETINEVNSDLFIIKLRECVKEYQPSQNINIPNELAFYIMFITQREIVKNHKIPVYDAIELREAFVYYIANIFKLREEAEDMAVGGILTRKKSGAVEIQPFKIAGGNLTDTIYIFKYKEIIKRRQRIHRQYIITNNCCKHNCFYGW